MRQRDFLVPTGMTSADAPQAEALEERIARLIQQYDSQGEHRTGTATDHHSARWLVNQVKQIGPRATLTRFHLSRVDPQSCYVQTPERRIGGLPMFDGTFTDAYGLVGRLGEAGGSAEFGLIIADQTVITSEGEALRALRQCDKHKALLIVTKGLRPGLTPMNARRFTAPFGPPVLQVSSEEEGWLRQVAQQQQTIRLVVHATRTPAQASNVVVRFQGTNPSLPPLVVMTPRSGWWQCTAERGGGLACWLEVIRTVQAHRPGRTTVCVASSGHELGHLGLEAFIARHPVLAQGAYAWIHFGANIGAARDTGALLQSSDEELEHMADAALARAGTGVQRKQPQGAVPRGEVCNIYERGGRYVSLIGTNAFFHHPGDRWPAEVDVLAVARYARAFTGLTLALTAH